MSIIADTLQRLQTRNHDEGTGLPDSQSIILPSRARRDPGWHNRPSRLKFWLAGIGMAIGLSGLGLVAYWIGFNLDFGMATYAYPGTGQRIDLSVSSPILETPHSDSQSSESMQMPVVNPVQDMPSSVPLEQEGEPLPSKGIVLSETPHPPNIDISLSTPLLAASPVSSESEARSISPTLRQSRQRTRSTNVATPNSATEFLSEKKSSELKTPSTSLPGTSFAQSDKPGSKLIKSEGFSVIETQVPIDVALEEKTMRMEEFSSTSHQSINATPLLPNMTAMIPKKEESSQTVRAPIPVQQSPTDRLRHAQQLIQTGKYEEAVAVLSPLFKDPPVDWEPWFWMGTALLGQSNLEQADQFFLSGLARNDKIPQLWVQRALVAHQREEYQLAIHELRRAESLDAAVPHTHLNMGYAYEKLGNDRLAYEYYAKFLKLSEGNPAFFSIRKKLYARFTEQVHSTLKPGFSSTFPENP